MESRNSFQFGPFSLDAEERLLLRDGRVVPLAPKALSTLLVLVRNRGHVVEKEALMAEIWPHEDVEEGNLSQHVFMLRRALGENPRYIETVPRRGYRFLDAVNKVKEPSRPSTENTEAYQAFLRGRYYRSKFTREGLEQAAACFRQAIHLDQTYGRAYAGIVDCYLRLATNYLPPIDALPHRASSMRALEADETPAEGQDSVKAGCEWDKTLAEIEYKRSVELKSDALAVHQWYAALLFSQNLYHHVLMKTGHELDTSADQRGLVTDVRSDRPQHSIPTLAEEVQVFCIVARAQIYTGNYDAAGAVLERWWTMGQWPKLDGLGPHSSADLLVTAGTLAGFVASTRQVPRGQKHAEALLNGAIGLFEQLGSRTLAAEGRIELAICYQREGLFDLARTTLLAGIEALSNGEHEIRRIALIRLATVEWQSGRLHDSIERLNQADEISEPASPLTTGRYHMELATSLQTLATAERRNDYFYRALDHYMKALEQYEAIGNHRYAAIVENNQGYLLLTLKRLAEAESHLVRAQKLFGSLNDQRRCAQLNDSLAHLHLAAGRVELAEQAVGKAVKTLETGGMEAYLAESLTTQGLVLCRLGRHREAKRVLERAYSVAERCGHREGAAHALLMEIEEMCEQLQDEERLELGARLDQLLASSQQASTLDRLGKCHDLIAAAQASDP